MHRKWTTCDANFLDPKNDSKCVAAQINQSSINMLADQVDSWWNEDKASPGIRKHESIPCFIESPLWLAGVGW
jgi:hypothetical protein